MSDAEPKLRAEIDSIRSHVDKLKAVVRRHRAVSASDPQALELADEAVALASSLIPKTVEESALAKEVVSEASS